MGLHAIVFGTRLALEQGDNMFSLAQFLRFPYIVGSSEESVGWKG